MAVEIIAAIITTKVREQLLYDLVLPSLQRELGIGHTGICLAEGQKPIEHVAIGGQLVWEFPGDRARTGMRWRKAAEVVARKVPDWSYILVLSDDIILPEGWCADFLSWVQDQKPGQYGLNLRQHGGKHDGQIWAQLAASESDGCNPYFITNGICDLPWVPSYKLIDQTSSRLTYVGNCVVHREVFYAVPPTGRFGDGADIQWSLAVAQAGFVAKYCPCIPVIHAGAYMDNR